MGFHLSPLQRSTAARLIALQWAPDLIAARVNCDLSTIYKYERSLAKWNSLTPPRRRKLGRSSRITPAIMEGLLTWLAREPWRIQSEMVDWIYEEYGLIVGRSTIATKLKKVWSRKKAQRSANRRNEELRRWWRVDMARFRAEEVVCVDESIFNEATGWRHFAYAPIGAPARYEASRNRGSTWAILPAYTTEGYLPAAITIKQGYFSGEEFLSWVQWTLIPACQTANKRIIILDNVAIHCRDAIRDVVEAADLEIHYLPPYSPDFNPIELTFNILKAWCRRNFDDTWPLFEGDFGSWLRLAIEKSECDSYAESHFRRQGYVFEGEMEAFQRAIEEGS